MLGEFSDRKDQIEFFVDFSSEILRSSFEMADREENVYKAKLAEQAERYDGQYR